MWPFSCFSLDFQLDPVCGVDEAGAAAMHLPRSILAFDAVVVQHLRRAVYRH